MHSRNEYDQCLMANSLKSKLINFSIFQCILLEYLKISDCSIYPVKVVVVGSGGNFAVERIFLTTLHSKRIAARFCNCESLMQKNKNRI